MASRQYQRQENHVQPAIDPSTWTEQLPLPRPYARSVGSYNTGLTYAQHEFLRRRKIPHGRQLEELDFTNIDGRIHLPAPKHVLLSLSPSNHDSRLPDGSRNTSYNDTPSLHHRGDRNVLPARGSQSLTNSQYDQAWMPPYSADSVLLQSTPYASEQQTSRNTWSKVPTVMPSNLQSSFGPTASAGQQYYGPYWPDGTFSPYRPAPVRNDRFFHWRHSRDLSQNSRPHQVNQVNQVNLEPIWTHGPALNAQQFAQGTVQGVRSLQSLPPRDGYVPYLSFQDRISDALVAGTSYHDRPTTEEGQFSISEQVPFKPQNQRGDGTLHATAASELIAQRDQAFSWAYRIYIDLLANIQRDSKLGRQHTNQLGQSRTVVKPAIFPRPPQRAQSHFTRSLNLKNGNQGSYKMHAGGESYQPMSIEASDRPQTAIRMTRRKTDSAAGGPGSFQSNNDYSSLVGNPVDTSLSFQERFNVMTGALMSTQQHIDNAAAALDTIEAICRDSEVSWTDGMLLAGCLAYGIGNYTQALKWYQKVVKLDSNHVEAISNLAATLLALGRRDEAANQWTAAIKLRPSYFEAVEHLVGLYVSSHRTRDAVDIIEYVESRLKLPVHAQSIAGPDSHIEDDSDDQSRASSTTIGSTDVPYYDFDTGRRYSKSSTASEHPQGLGAFGYAVPVADNGRLLALIHAKGNMLYSLGDNRAAASAFEDAILIATGERKGGVRGLIERILQACVSSVDPYTAARVAESKEPILLTPDRAQTISQRMFPPSGELPGLEHVPSNVALKAAISTSSNSLLSLAKIYQDGLCSQTAGKNAANPGTREILALYYLSLSLQPSPSTANNVGILLAGVQTASVVQVTPQHTQNCVFNYTGVSPGSGVALALAYYNYGLNLDGKHAHLYTNLGSLLKDLGKLQAAIKMYETAVSCDGTFDIALANLANAVKDQGRIADAIKYYKRAVQANPDFAEAVCGLATALNSVCDWYGRGGVYADGGLRDRIHVDERGMMYEGRKGSGWMHKVVEIVDRQLRDGESWGVGILKSDVIELICNQLTLIKSNLPQERQMQTYRHIQQSLQAWAGRKWEGSRVVRLLERAIKYIGWQWYQDRYKHKREYPSRRYTRPTLPVAVPVPSAPTVLPFHTFTTPLSARQVRQISQRNALRISVSTMRSSWLPRTVYPPPAPPNPCLNVGYVSSDFNNHPLAHLMQSIFGLHNPRKIRAHCYATTASDGSIHRQQIEREAPVFRDASTWSVERLVNQIVEDGIHILVNLNGYTRGAKNELFAARPAPIHMSFMGFAGTLGAEWCDYVYADEISVPQQTLAPSRYNVDVEDKLNPRSQAEDLDDWIYAENIIFSRSSFFCVDHKQSAPDAKHGPPRLHDECERDQAWTEEQRRRWKLRKELFPSLPENAVILGNFNQLYKIDPTTFRLYLRILSAVPNTVLWLLRFPDVGEQNLRHYAQEWAGPETASRILFTDVAPKGLHITRASVVDLFLDTPECNAHTTAADVIWSGTPIVTWARWDHKMCSRMASSIVASALPEGPEGDEGRRDLLVGSEKEYEDRAIQLASNLRYVDTDNYEYSGQGHGRLLELRRMLWEGRWTSRLFDTKRWVSDLEMGYWKAWTAWEAGEGGDIWL
ncbi:hypothetical protein LTS08_000317 [Lithohypha guttulata]|nr:hypothetical protein LTS08_000317 [Lithohypha guttulata]